MRSATALQKNPQGARLKLYDSYSFDKAPTHKLAFRRVLFAICPTGRYCREDRCQSFFKYSLIPNMRVPLEECEAAGAIIAAGASAQIIDAPAENLSEQQFLLKVESAKPDLIVVVTTFGTLADDLTWVRKLKEHLPSVKIGARGAPCYVNDHQILTDEPKLDFCVKGEYEIVFHQIVSFGLESAEGVSRRLNDRVIAAEAIPRARDLNILPMPQHRGINFASYTARFSRRPQATIRVQRGCPFPCTYCLVHTVNGDSARHRSPRLIVAEINALCSRGIRSFYLRADTFTVDRAWALDVCAAIAEHCPGVRWITTTRAEKFDQELADAMAAAGCYGISFGLDVTSKKIGEQVKKLANAGTAQRAFDACTRAGIVSLAYIMIGFIWETKETLDETRRFLSLITPDLITIHFAHPYPGTRYHTDVAALNRRVISPRAQAEPALVPLNLTVDELQQAARQLLISHYRRPTVLASLAKKSLRRMLRHFIPTRALKEPCQTAQI